MLIVEVNTPKENPVIAGGHSRDICYNLIGDDEELRRAHRQLTSLAIAAMEESDITADEAAELLRRTESASPITVFKDSASAFLKIVTQAEILTRGRHNQLLEAGRSGTLGAIAISDEWRLLDSYGGGPFYAGKTDYCSKDGIGMIPNSDTTSIELEIREAQEAIKGGYFEDWQEEVIAELPVTHFGRQYELPEPPYYGLSGIPDHRHTSVGVLDEDGRYIPFATVLDSSYINRAALL